MAIYNLGSINIDHVYRVAHLPRPGETLSATSYAMGLGGKGANQSAASARAGARVVHIGAVGPEGGWALDRLASMGVDVSRVMRLAVATGHAIIQVDASAENAITLFPGANYAFGEDELRAALEGAGAGDTLILQNETAHQALAAEIAHSRGMRVIYSAAPFSIDAVRAVMPYVSALALNELEAAQLSEALGTDLQSIPVPALLVTRGKAGAEWHEGGAMITAPAFRVEAVDTTGAGDTFAGWFAACLDAGKSVPSALREASAAAALKVTRAGAADAIPSRDEVAQFLASQS